MTFRVGIVLAAAMVLIAAVPIHAKQLQGPAPSSGPHVNQPQAHTTSTQTQPAQEQSGAENKPLFIELEDSKEQREEANKHAAYEDQEATNNRLIADFTVVLGVVGALQLILVGLQIYWMWRTVSDSNAQHSFSERAYIYLDGFNPELATRADGLRDAKKLVPEAVLIDAELDVTRFAAQPIWGNNGGSSTRNMTIRVDWSVGDSLRVGTYRSEPQRLVVAPKAREASEFIEMPGLNALIQHVLRVNPGLQPLLLIWGRADYGDVFGKRHWLQWCYRVRPDRHDGEKLRVGFIQWGDYNTSSDETA